MMDDDETYNFIIREAENISGGITEANCFSYPIELKCISGQGKNIYYLLPEIKMYFKLIGVKILNESTLYYNTITIKDETLVNAIYSHCGRLSYKSQFVNTKLLPRVSDLDSLRFTISYQVLDIKLVIEDEPSLEMCKIWKRKLLQNFKKPRFYIVLDENGKQYVTQKNISNVFNDHIADLCREAVYTLDAKCSSKFIIWSNFGQFRQTIKLVSLDIFNKKKYIRERMELFGFSFAKVEYCIANDFKLVGNVIYDY